MFKSNQHNTTLAGKVAIVTGAGTEGEGVGIGKAIAMVLAREGARVCLVDLDADRAQATGSEIAARGGDAFSTAGDVTNREHCARFVEDTISRYDRLDILVNNVGIATPVPLDAPDETQWSQVLDINLTSAMLMARYAVPEMAKNGGGSIINIASIAGIRAQGSIAYGPSKAAMTQLSRELALLYGRQGIRANTVSPGHLLTPLAERLLPPEMRTQRRDVSPLGIEGDAWDVALAVRFLASDEARFITGVNLPVDGGVTEIGALPAHALILSGPTDN